MYSCSLGDVIAAVLKFPQFAGLDHARVVRDACRLGKRIGLSQREIRDRILKNPILAGYSAKRYIAGLDVARALHKEAFPFNETMLFAYFSNIGKSPYIPDSKRERISHVDNYQEPPLMTVMRKYLINRA